MSLSLVLTVIGDDRPGIVEQIATAISEHNGNWLESSMSHLAGKFAGIVCVSIPDSQLDAVKSGRIHIVPNGAMAWAYNGPEAYLAMQFFAKAIQPELFTDLWQQEL